MVYTLRFFSSKCSLFHNSNAFVSCIIHILYTGCAKIEKNNSGAKRLSWSVTKIIPRRTVSKTHKFTIQINLATCFGLFYSHRQVFIYELR